MKMVKRGFYLTRGAEKKYFSIIYVKDLAEGLIAAAESDKSEGQKYFLCNEKPTTYDEICKLAAAALQKKVIKISIPSLILEASAPIAELYAKMTKKKPLITRRRLKGKPSYWICNGSKAKRELGYQPTTELAEGIEKTAVWYSKHGWI